MSYIGLLLIPLVITVMAVLSPSARQSVIRSAEQGMRNGAAYISDRFHAINSGQGIGASLDHLRRRVAATLLRQAADSIEQK